MKIKAVLGQIGLCMLMVGMGWVPESDIPKETKDPLFDLAVAVIKVTAHDVSWELGKMKIAVEEEIVEEEIEEVVDEPYEEEYIEEEYEEDYEEIIEEVTEEEVIEQIDEVIEEEREAFDDWDNDMEYLGSYDITAYEWTGNPCANGNYPTEGYTVACNSLPLGTTIYIDGVGYRTVEDRGATWHSSNWIDLYLGDVPSCNEWGVRTRDVWIVH